ncbi:MAG: 50S ribosomal protein L10 [Candidatus Poseidoniaceae archaeon]
MIPKVASWKKDTVSSLTEMLSNGGTIAVIDIHGVPASAMIGMRAGLRNQLNIQVAKKRLMKLAWEAVGNDFSDLEEIYSSAVQPALVQSNISIIRYRLIIFDQSASLHSPNPKTSVKETFAIISLATSSFISSSGSTSS